MENIVRTELTIAATYKPFSGYIDELPKELDVHFED